MKKVKAVQLVPAVPVWVIALLWPVSLCLPNLIYSGIRFADTLHILKWTVTAMPVLIALLVLGVRLFSKRTLTPQIDLHAVIFAVLLVYCALMPLWTQIFSPTGYALEMACFASMFAFYVLTVQYWKDSLLKPILLLAAVNAVINTVFAELQIRGMNDLKFLQGTIFADIIPFSTIILPTPGNYIGNTAQQNMFGLWTAISVLGMAYLCTYDEPEKFKPQVHRIFSGALMAGAFWGLMNSTSRSAVLALSCGLAVMTLITLWKGERRHFRRLVGVFIVLGAVFWLSMYSPRSGAIIDKTADIIRHAENIGNRRGIWTTSASMFLEHPMGVGIGQYKWHYMEAQRYGFGIFPYDWYTWQYTHWAHNEFLQFFCEGGVIGGIIFMAMYLSWFVSAFLGLKRSERGKISSQFVWACGLVVLITFSAGFTRPFHRIENIVWIMLAFAIISRTCSHKRFAPQYRKPLGAVCVISCLAGTVYLGSGIYGNYLLRSAMSTSDARLQRYFLEQAQLHPIVYEDTMRNLGYHYMQLGEQTNNNETLAKGFNILWEHFNHEPHSEDISRILMFVQKYQVEEVLREVASYFRPGTYHLKRVPQRDSEGHIVNALLLMNGPGSDDQ
ncbi:MAG: O-antigen ligase family protein [Synergistaceae bacterium]|nr:O-antigen ligase family protein [Synergistaceae bacterium]